jgi:HPr kinase/phosphorylase
LIEARGVGLLRVPVAGPVPLTLVIDLSQTEAERLPYPHSHTVAEITLPCLWAVPAPHFAPAILLYLQGGLGVTP